MTLVGEIEINILNTSTNLDETDYLYCKNSKGENLLLDRIILGFKTKAEPESVDGV